MSYGFTAVFGRPLPDEFIQWFESNLKYTEGVEWHPRECIHATIANCTMPRARSVKSQQEALGYREVIREAALRVLLPCLGSFEQIRIEFGDVRVAGRSVILPSKRSPEISSLKRLLQGGRDCIWEQEVEDVLTLANVFGVDKFSTRQGSLQPSLKLTLGDIGHDTVHLPRTDAPPVLNATSLRLVFYRDRKLLDAVISHDLEFDKSGTQKKLNRRRILDFFDDPQLNRTDLSSA